MQIDRANDLLGDFETRSEVDLTKAGMAAYAEHPSTTILCLGWEAFGEKGLWKPGDDFPAVVLSCIKLGKPFLGWNVGFEWYMWNKVLVHMVPNLPKLDIEQCYDIAAWARAMGFPAALDKASDAMKLPVGKDLEGRRIMLRLCKPVPVRKGSEEELLGIVKYDNDPEKFKKLYAYCERDITAERYAALKVKPLSDVEQQVWLLDFKINERGITLDEELVYASDRMVDKAKSAINDKIYKHTRKQIRSTNQNVKLLDWINGQIATKSELPELLSLSKEAIEDYQYEYSDAVPDAVDTALELRLQGAKASTAKLNAMLRSRSADGKLRGMLMYHAAGPGRWGGRRVQVQNFPRPTLSFSELELVIDCVIDGDIDTLELLFDIPMHALSEILRGMLRASKGKEIVAGDLSAIECRVLAWLAGQESLLHQFKVGEDPYVHMASKIPGGDRFLGKTAVLGCGYGMGGSKFQGTCKKQGRRISLDLGQKAVKAYRAENKAVTKFWRDVEDAAFYAVQHPDSWITCRRIKLQKRGDNLWMRLPSKRLLCYPYVDIRDTERPWGQVAPSVTYETFVGYTQKWERVPTYGGKLTENACQAIARDVMVHGMFLAERAGYETIFTVHDENVSERDKGEGNLTEFLACMTKRPNWAEGLPIKAEGWIGERYRKG